MYPTDIEQLHKAIENQNTWNYRRTGKTTIMIHNLAGQIQTGNIEYIFIWIKCLRDMDHLIPMIRQIFYEKNIKIINIKRERSEIETIFEDKHNVIRFLSFSNPQSEHKTRGY
jgi:hypothetical protein